MELLNAKEHNTQQRARNSTRKQRNATDWKIKANRKNVNQQIHTQTNMTSKPQTVAPEVLAYK